MGLSYEEVKKLNKEIIYTSISGFGEKGPYSSQRVYDPVIQALSGLADIQRDQKTNFPKMVRTIIPCLLYTSPSPRDQRGSRMPSSA